METKKMGAEEELYLAPEHLTALQGSNADESSEAAHFEMASPVHKTKKSKQMKEIRTLRGKDRKVFSLGDGMTQAVFYPSPVHVFDDETRAFEEAESKLTEESDGKHFVCKKHEFVAKFSREEENDELFSMEQGMHRVTVYARKSKKNKNKGILPALCQKESDGDIADVLTYAEVEKGADYEYSVECDGVKENIVIREKATAYRYPFSIVCENVTAKFEKGRKRIVFLSLETGEEAFCIPAPFMYDANGASSHAVSYEVKPVSDSLVHLTVLADADFINAEGRAFPVVIDPQIKLSGSNAMTTYSYDNGTLYSSARHTVGTTGNGDGCCNIQRMYMQLKMPTLPHNPRIQKAELVFAQFSGVAACAECPKIGLFSVTEDIREDSYTPTDDENLIDFAKMKVESTENGAPITYTFDITTLLDQVNRGEDATRNLVLKMLDEENCCNNSITLYGSRYSGTYAPRLIVTYQSSYGVNPSYRTHTHSLGRFGQGSIDLQCGNLMFECEDFAWSGNRMPVTVKHLYNSALSDSAYTQNSEIGLHTAPFAPMKVGHGFRLNLMQSVMPLEFCHENETYQGYVYIDENGEETYLKEGCECVCFDNNSQCYHLYEDVEDGGLLYDPCIRTLKQGDDTYLFDENGRLVKITDASGNFMEITYTDNRITTVTDGAGREFFLGYSNGELTSITAPGGAKMEYTYTDNLLTAIKYPDGRKAVIAYAESKPQSVTLLDTSGIVVYQVAYTFAADRVASVTEYGINDTMGASSAYDYSAASARTLVTTTEPKDVAEGETEDHVIRTVYTFDDEGNVISQYAYTEDTGNIGVESKESGIHPYAGEGGIGTVSRSNNFLKNHSFEGYASWTGMADNAEDFAISTITIEGMAKYGIKAFRLQSMQAECMANGVFQSTDVLPAGQYTFSAYLQPISAFSGNDHAGVYLRVTDSAGNVLGISERLVQGEYQYMRLAVPFTLGSEESVNVQILVNGKGDVYVDAAQLEDSPFANEYNMLTNGNFEGTTGWTKTDGSSYTQDTCFSGSQCLMICGDVDEDSYAYQAPAVRKERATRETFTLSGWAKGWGLPTHDRDGVSAPTFRLRAVVKYNDTLVKEYGSEEFTADFSPCTEEWQFATVQFSKSKYAKVQYVRIYCDYGYNSGVAYFDGIQLVRDSLETDLPASDFSAEDTTFVDDEATQSTVAAEDTTPAFEEVKDTFGNTLTETTYTDGELGTLYRAFAFDEDGNDLVCETDASGNTTLYTVNEDTSRNEEVTDRLGNKTAYEYDASGRTTQVTSIAALRDEEGHLIKDGNENIQYESDPMATVSYSYDAFDNMTQIARGDGMKYALAYNAFHNLASIGIEGKTKPLIRYTYKNGNGRLKQMTYANGDTMKAIYNSTGQMTGEVWQNASGVEIARYIYVYDGQGNIVRSIDIFAQKEYTYVYEEGRIVRATESAIILSGEIVTYKTVLNTIQFVYDSEGQMIRKVIVPADSPARTVYYETGDDNTVVKFSAGGRTVTSHSKTDSFGRKVFDELQLGKDFVSRQFVYHAGEVTQTHKDNVKVKSSATTQLVSQIILSGGRTLSYEYDAEERITKVTDSIDGTTEYTYDALGQLLTETVTKDGVTTVVNSMEYDNYGNITKKNGKVYTYDTTWKDLLTCYDGQSIAYDDQGNPTSYLGQTLTWEKGRQLKTLVKGTGDSRKTYTFTYNASGIRTSKALREGDTLSDTRVHKYTLNGAEILRETVYDPNMGGDSILYELYPLRDNEEAVCGIIHRVFEYTEAGKIYQEIPYYFQKNLQGDVIAIVDSEAAIVARYSYDAWGKILSITDKDGNPISPLSAHIANINPYRYRGYYYDEETKLYYLQSRYYDADIGRFINEDSRVGINTGILSYALYSYCGNDPISRVDTSGYAWFKKLAVLVAAVIVVVAVAHVVNAAVAISQADELDGYSKYGVIDSQSSPDVASIHLGRETIGSMGCGAVATHNAIILANSKDITEAQTCRASNFADVVKFMRTHDLTLGFGGVYFTNIQLYLKRKGYRNRIRFFGLKGKLDNMIKNSKHGVAILAYRHSGGGHYIAIKYDKAGKNFYVYNGDNKTESSMDGWAKDPKNVLSFYCLITLR